jgi:hypothetical protein
MSFEPEALWNFDCRPQLLFAAGGFALWRMDGVWLVVEAAVSERALATVPSC